MILKLDLKHQVPKLYKVCINDDSGGGIIGQPNNLVYVYTKMLLESNYNQMAMIDKKVYHFIRKS